MLSLVLLVYLGLPTAFGISALWPSRAKVGPAPTGFREVTIAGSDGTRLSAWYAPSRNGSAIVLAHGAGGSRQSMRRLAQMLARRGYGVLSLDLAGHGESQGRTNRFGWRGTRDVASAVDFLRAQEATVSIGGLGMSMGGEVLLGASAECPGLKAIVADGATRRSTAELLALPSERPLLRNFTQRVMFGAVQAFSAERPPAPLLAEMRRSRDTRFLLIAAGDNDLEVAYNQRFAQVVGGRAQLWVVPGVEHTGAMARYPEDYEHKIIAFFDSTLAR